MARIIIIIQVFEVFISLMATVLENSRKITKTNSEWVYLSAATTAGTHIRYNKANVNIAIIVKLTRVENALQQLTGARGEYRFARMR